MESHDSPISLLNQICVRNSLTPTYILIASEGMVHAPTFTYRVQLVEYVEEGSGPSKKKAKHVAARNMLRRLLNQTNLIEEKETVKRVLKRCDDEDIAEALALQKSTKEKQNETCDASTNLNPKSTSTNEAANEEENPIGKLQEICMKKHWNPPIYEDYGEKGAPHEREFHVDCMIESLSLKQRGMGKSKKVAKRAAALQMLNQLRKDNLDKIDDLLDNLPKSFSDDTFDFASAYVNMRRNKDSKLREDDLQDLFFRDLASDSGKLENLKMIFNCSQLQDYVLKYMDEEKIIDNVEKLVVKIELILNCKLDVSVYSEKRKDASSDKFQCLAEFIAKDPKYDSVCILCSYGMDESIERAKLKSMSRCIALLICNII